MKHVMLWYLRSWKYSAVYDNDLKTFNWSTEMQCVLFEETELSANVKTSWTNKDARAASEKLLRSIWNVMLQKNNFWKSVLKFLINIIKSNSD